MLTEFNKIVLIIATIVLIIMLILLYLFLSKALFEDSYPPVISNCPDYWDISLNSEGENICINTNSVNIGNNTEDCINIQPIQFELDSTSKEDTLCSKYNWAKSCKITWDGITNNTTKCNN